VVAILRIPVSLFFNAFRIAASVAALMAGRPTEVVTAFQSGADFEQWPDLHS
jgi:hypothetical protein